MNLGKQRLAKDYRSSDPSASGSRSVPPEWMSEKAVSIGNYVVGTGTDTFLGVDPYVEGSDQMGQLLTGGTRQWTGAAYTVEKDIDKLVDLMIERIEEKRTALGI